MSSRTARVLSLLVAALSACGDPAHENPFDPATPPDQQAKATLAGTVTLEALDAGEPARSGVLVSVPGTSLSAVTDADGAYAIADVPPGTYAVQATRAGYRDATVSGITVTLADGDRTVAVPAIALEVARGTVLGKVALQLDAPSGALEDSAGGVSVKLSNRPGAAFTDVGGNYEFAAVPIGTYVVTASKAGFQEQTVELVEVTEGRVTVLAELTLPPDPGGISGTVLAEGASDSFGVVVRASGATLSGTPTEVVTLSAADGTWLVSPIPAGTYAVTFEKPGYRVASAAAVVAPAQITGLVPVTIARETGAVTGAFALAGLGSSDGVVVTIQNTPFATVTDVGGAFTLTGVPVGTYTVTATKPPDWQGVSIAGVVVSRDGTTPLAGSPVTLAPLATARLEGTVALEGQASAAGALVTLSGVDFRGAPVSATATAPASGAWSFETLVAGSYQVSFERAGFDAATPLGVSLLTGQVRTVPAVTLARSRGAIAGTALLAGAASSAGVVVSATGASAASTVTDADGAFALAGLPVGTYALTFRRDPEWAPVTVAGVEVTAGGTAAVPGGPISLSPIASASVAGTALAEGAAAAGTTVTLDGQDFRGVAVSATTSTGASGAWSFAGLRSGSYQVTFARAGWEPPAPLGLSLVTGQAATLAPVTLAASRGAVAGTVTATGAASQAGTVVTVSGGPDSASTVTDAAGAWRIEGLRTGTGYAATYSRTAYAPATSAPFAVAASATTPAGAAALALDASGGIAGVARLERPVAPHDGIAVSLTGLDVNGAAIAAATSTAADGSFQLAGLPQGTYALAFSKAGYDAQAAAGLFVAAGAQVAAPDALLPVARGTIAGTVALTAGGVAGFQVGTDLSGVVVVLGGTDVPVPSVVTDASGAYRFVSVPVSLAGAAFTVTARKPFHRPDSTTVTAVADATATAAPLSLALASGTLSGTVLLRDDVANGGDNAVHGGTTVGISGTSFSGVGWSTAATTAASGAWTSGALPPGTFDLVPASDGRTCASYPRTALGPDDTIAVGTIRCVDALAPGALALGAPTPSAGAQPGYTRLAAVVVPVATPAADPTVPASNLRGYQLAVGGSPDWSTATTVPGQPASLTFGPLAANARNVLWARAVDWLGNAGPATSAEVVTDSTLPPVPTLATPRLIVDDTSTSVTLSGSETDANFAGYEACSTAVAATAACPGTAPVGCTFATATPNLSLALAASQKTCLFARARDLAGNVSGQATLAVVSDLVPPTAPTFSPVYDPTVFTASADYVDFFVTGASTDAPAGTGAWGNVAWVEADTGAGFEPLCPKAACRPGGVYAPCAAACACTDPRLLCRGTEFAGVRMPLLGGTANRVSIRAVDVAGNVGSGATQLVNTGSPTQLVATSLYSEAVPRTRHGLLTLTGDSATGSGAFTSRLVVLGADKRFDPTDVTCDLETPYNSGTYRSHEPITPTAVAYVGDWARTMEVRRASTDGDFCTGDDTSTVLRDVGPDVAGPPAVWPRIVAAAGSLDSTGTKERAAWAEGNVNWTAFSFDIVVREPGPDGRLDGPGDALETDVPVAHLAGDFPNEVLLGGDVLLYRSTYAGYTVVTAGTGSFTGPLSSWQLPAGTLSAALDGSGALLAWVEYDAVRAEQVIHLLTAGLDGIFGTVDDVERTRGFAGPALYAAGIAVEAGHVVMTEVSLLSASTYWVNHWYAGGDGRFGTDDDVASRILPSSRARPYPALDGGIAAGTTYFQVGFTNVGGENADVLAVDLSATRWEVASHLALSYPRSNGEGTLFYRDANDEVYARSSDGRERAYPGSASSFAADGTSAYLAVGGSRLVRARPDPATGLWFTTGAPPDEEVSTAMAWGGAIEANDGYVVAEQLAPGSPTYALAVLREDAPGTWSATRIDDDPAVAGTIPIPLLGLGVSSFHAAWACQSGTQYVCVRSRGADGILGTGDDPTTRIVRPGTAFQYMGVSAVRVYRNRVMVVAWWGGAQHLSIVDAGPDRAFNTGDEVETDLGAVTEFGNGYYDFRGDMVAWAAVVGGKGGNQVFLHDLRDGTRRQLTSHYSFKPEVRVEPSGRVHWVDSLLQARAVFVSAP